MHTFLTFDHLYNFSNIFFLYIILLLLQFCLPVHNVNKLNDRASYVSCNHLQYQFIDTLRAGGWRTPACLYVRCFFFAETTLFCARRVSKGASVNEPFAITSQNAHCSVNFDHRIYMQSDLFFKCYQIMSKFFSSLFIVCFLFWKFYSRSFFLVPYKCKIFSRIHH